MGPITITLLHSNMASSSDERYLEHWTCPVPCYQVHTKWLYQLSQNSIDKTETFSLIVRTCLNYRIFYLQLNPLIHQPFNLISLFTSTSILLVLDQVPTTNLSPHHLNNICWDSYFHQLSSLLNAMPVFGLNISFVTLKSKLKKYLWKHFWIILMITITALCIICAHSQNAINPDLLTITYIVFVHIISTSSYYWSL